MGQARLDGIASELGIPEPDETPRIERVDHPAIRHLEIPLEPMVWRRAGFNKKTGQHFTEKKCRQRMDEIKLLWRGRRLEKLPAGPCGMRLEFIFEHDASHFDSAGHLLPEWIGTRPGQNKGDLDNLVKLVKDALSKVAYGDDAQVAELAAAKDWAVGGERSHTRVALWPL